MIIQNIDHVAVGRSYTLEQSKDKLVLNNLSDILLSPLQEVEEEVQNLLKKRWIEDATGKQLDGSGAIVGERRYYKDDEEYRKAIFARISINYGGGTPEEIMNAVTEIYNASDVIYRDSYPASFLLYIQLDQHIKGKRTLVESISPAGVSATLICHVGTAPFYFSECTTEQTEFIVKNVKTLRSNLDIKLGSDTNRILNASTDVMTGTQNWLGFSEIITSRKNLSVKYEEDIEKDYLVDKDTILETTNSLKDFIIVGGSRFAEINDL